MNESGSGVAIAHLGWDLTLVGDQECARQRSIVPKRAVYRTGGTRSYPRQYVGRRLALVRVSSWTLGRSRRDGKNRSCREYQRECRSLGSSAIKCSYERDRGGDDCDPGKSRKSSEKTANVRQVCGCDEWQLGSGLRLPNARPLAQHG